MSALARAERAGNPQSPDVLTTANFNRGRFDWMHVVMADPKLPASAKTIAAVLVTRFAHHQTGHCAPKDATIAAATGLKADTVYRQLRLLAEAGYIEVLDRQRGSGRYAFRTLAVSESRGQVVPMRPREASEPGCTSGTARQKPDANPDEHPANPDVHPSPPKPPYKEHPKVKPKARATRKDQLPLACVRLGSAGEEEWNRWLIANGYPTLNQIGAKCSDGPEVGWQAPFRYPPGNDRQTTTARKFFAQAEAQPEPLPCSEEGPWWLSW